MTWKEILKLAREDASLDNRLIVYYDYVDGEYGIHPEWQYILKIDFIFICTFRNNHYYSLILLQQATVLVIATLCEKQVKGGPRYPQVYSLRTCLT